MEFIRPGINIDIIGKRYVAFALSIALVLGTFLLLIWRGGPNYGVDFTGGILIQVKLDQPSSLPAIREALTTGRDTPPKTNVRLGGAEALPPARRLGYSVCPP